MDWGVAPRYDWRQHPTEPMPFFVLDYVKWPDNEKLAWIRQDIGSDAELEHFTEKLNKLAGVRLSAVAKLSFMPNGINSVLTRINPKANDI